MVGGIIAGKINMYDLQTRMAKHFKKELTFLLNNQMGEDPGEQRWRSGKSTRLPLMWPGLKSWHQRPYHGLNLMLVLPLAPRGLSPGTHVFRSP